MSIAIDSHCMECYLGRHLAFVRTIGTEEQATRFARGLMQLYLDAPEGVSSPYLAPGVADLLHEIYGLSLDRYKEEKAQSNAFVMERFDKIAALAEAAPDPVFAGLQLAILGNYLDFAALQNQVSFDSLEEMLKDALSMELDRDIYARFCAELERGGKLLYLTDNAGEIGFDRIFAEQLAKKYPRLEITFCVRGDYANNDATREDAALVGIPFPVIDNGNRIPGTQLDMLGEEARLAMASADVMLAKGMANCETMSGCGLNVYYAFLVKCQRFVTRFRAPMLTPIFTAERN